MSKLASEVFNAALKIGEFNITLVFCAPLPQAALVQYDSSRGGGNEQNKCEAEIQDGIVAPGVKVNWLTWVPLNTYSMILAWIWQQLGTSMVLFLAGLTTVPRDPVEASIIDGANKWQTFVHVTFPMLRPITTVVITMAMVNSFKAFDMIYVMTKGGPYRSSETLAVTMFRETFTMFNMGYGAAISVLLSLLLILVSIAYIKSMWKKDLLYY